MMKVVVNRPLIFIDTPGVDEISVEFRRVHKMLQDTMEITHSDFSSLQDLIEDDSSITYGIVKAGEPDPDGVPVVKVENIRKDRTIDVEGLMKVSPSISSAYARTILHPRDILISIKGTIGRIAEVPDELDSANITSEAPPQTVESTPVGFPGGASPFRVSRSKFHVPRLGTHDILYETGLVRD